MLGISRRTLNLTTLFGILPVAALGHDIYIWQRDGNIFTLADLGGIFRHYAPEQFDQTVTFLGAETFNAVLTPVLAHPAVYIGVALTLLVFALSFAKDCVMAAKAAKDGTSNPNVKSFRKSPPETQESLKNKVLYKRR